MKDTDALVERYLARLRRELRDVPAAWRGEIVEEIEAHLAVAREEAADEAELRTLIDRLGDPAEIAAEARERFGVPTAVAPSPRRSWVEVAAVILLPIGAVVLPVIGWVVGLVLLWSSHLWTLRDKLIGTLVVPFGLLPAVWFVGVAAIETCNTSSSADRPPATTCTGGGTSPWLVALGVFLLVAPFASAAYLAWRTRPRTSVSRMGGAVASG